MDGRTAPPHVAILGQAPLTVAGLRTVLAERGISVNGTAYDVHDLEATSDSSDVIIVLHDDDLAAVDAAVPDNVAVLLLANDWPTQPPRERTWGIVVPSATGDEISAAVQALALGLCVLPPELLQPLAARASIMQPLTLPEPLTEREREVLQLLSEGLTNRQIAGRLIISEHTVKFHVSSIYGKLGTASRTEAIRVGAQHGLIIW